jgi:hypothetical protein
MTDWALAGRADPLTNLFGSRGTFGQPGPSIPRFHREPVLPE